MGNKGLSSLSFSALVFFLILSLFSGVGINNIISYSSNNAYISAIFSCIFGLFILGVFLYIFNYKKELDISEKINFLFGNYLGTFLNYLISFLIFIIGTVILYNITNFAISQFLSETPLIIFMIIFVLVCIYNVSKGMANIARVGIIFLSIVIMLTIISTLGIIPNFEVSNLKPFLEDGIGVPMMGGILLTFTNTISLFTLLSFPKNQIINNEKTNKQLLIFYLLASFFEILAITLTMGSLGIILCELYQYPEYTVLKKISLFGFIDRIENFVYIKWIFDSFMSLSLIIYYLAKSIKKESQKLMPSLIGIGMIAFSLYVFKNNTFFYTFCLEIFPYLNLLLFCLFLIIGLNIVLRKLLN